MQISPDLHQNSTGDIGNVASLTVTTLRALTGGDKVKRVWDGGGLYLEVRPSGKKVWLLKYRVTDPTGKRREKRPTLGEFNPNPKPGYLTLAQARKASVMHKAEIETGHDPAVDKKVAKVERVIEEDATFKKMASDWIIDESRRMEWSSDHEKKVTRSLEMHVFSALGGIPICDIRAKHVFPVMQALRLKSPDMAAKVEQRVRATFDYAVDAGVIDITPLTAKRRSPKKKKSYPALLNVGQLHKFMAKAEAANLSRGVYQAHLLLAFTCQRVSEVVGATWDEIDFDTALWTVPRNRMKMKEDQRPDQVIPLPPILLSQLRRWHDVSNSDYVCPGPRSGNPVSREAVEKCYPDHPWLSRPPQST